MEELREKLIKSIKENGRNAYTTIKLSQKLDSYIVVEQRKMLGGS
ncbi:aspartyl-phosphate phosphatase Spo0E family protein [Clostridium botulinum]|nr:aspartyl-phosphate phosphatase Spo0E family protein [Clostridium botulinum]MBN1050296.1 aspartyl-phosphate phosphatase Spo0E family protein [Clostridium botulinum]